MVDGILAGTGRLKLVFRFDAMVAGNLAASDLELRLAAEFGLWDRVWSRQRAMQTLPGCWRTEWLSGSKMVIVALCLGRPCNGTSLSVICSLTGLPQSTWVCDQDVSRSLHMETLYTKREGGRERERERERESESEHSGHVTAPTASQLVPTKEDDQGTRFFFEQKSYLSKYSWEHRGL